MHAILMESLSLPCKGCFLVFAHAAQGVYVAKWVVYHKLSWGFLMSLQNLGGLRSQPTRLIIQTRFANTYRLIIVRISMYRYCLCV